MIQTDREKVEKLSKIEIKNQLRPQLLLRRIDTACYRGISRKSVKNGMRLILLALKTVFASSCVLRAIHILYILYSIIPNLFVIYARLI